MNTTNKKRIAFSLLEGDAVQDKGRTSDIMLDDVKVGEIQVSYDVGPRNGRQGKDIVLGVSCVVIAIPGVWPPEKAHPEAAKLTAAWKARIDAELRSKPAVLPGQAESLNDAKLAARAFILGVIR